MTIRSLLCGAMLLVSPAEKLAAGTSQTTQIVYHDDRAAWVLGQVASTTNADTGMVESRTVYDQVTALPVATYDFGKLQRRMTWHANGALASSSDGRDGVGGVDTTIAFSYYKRGIPQKVAHPDGTSRSTVVDDLGQIAAVVDETGAKTCYAYDAMGRPASTQHPSETTPGACNAASWNALTRTFTQAVAASHGLPAGHWREEERQGNGHKVVYYDALWQPVLTHVFDGADVAGTSTKSATRYDAHGRVVFQSYPLRDIADFQQAALKGTRTSYDALDRVTRVEQDSELGVLVSTTAYLLDAGGAYTQVTNPRGHQVRTWFQMFDAPDYTRPVKVVHPDQAVTEIARDVFGKPKTITRRDANKTISSTRRYFYDAHQALCRTSEPETGEAFFGYDAAGNLAWSASGYSTAGTQCVATSAVAPRRIDRTYDNRNRLKSVSFPDGLGDTTHTWTPDGLPASVTANNGGGNLVTTSYSYNRRRLLTSERMAFGGIAWTVGYGYDANGHLASQAYPGGLVVPYAPNALGQPTKAGTFATGAKYHPKGTLAGFTYGNGIVHAATQNARQLPDRSRDAHGAIAVFDDNYDYDGNANLEAISDGLPGHRGNRTMMYDNRDRLASVASPMFGGTIFFGHDALDNITSVSAPNRSHRFCYDARWRLTFVRAGATVACPGGAAITALEYDAQGNVARKNNVAYSFDFGNRLRATSGGVASSYVYDGHGRRVRDNTTGSRYSLYTQDGKVAFTSDRKAEYTNHIYLGDRLVATRSWPHGSSTFTTRYQHTDALGTPVAVTDASRKVVQRSEYEPYGKVVNRPQQDGVGFTGHVEDAATGLVYMQQRYFDRDVFRMLSVDPVTAYGGDTRYFNRYWYAAGNPYKYTDPDGSSPRYHRRYWVRPLQRVQASDRTKLVKCGGIGRGHRRSGGPVCNRIRGGGSRCGAWCGCGKNHRQCCGCRRLRESYAKGNRLLHKYARKRENIRWKRRA